MDTGSIIQRQAEKLPCWFQMFALPASKGAQGTVSPGKGETILPRCKNNLFHKDCEYWLILLKFNQSIIEAADRQGQLVTAPEFFA